MGFEISETTPNVEVMRFENASSTVGLVYVGPTHAAFLKKLMELRLRINSAKLD